MAMTQQQAAQFYAALGIPAATGAAPALQPAQAPNAPDLSYMASPSTQAQVNSLYGGILPVSRSPIMPGGDNYNDPGDTGGYGGSVPSSIAGDNAIVNGQNFYAPNSDASLPAAAGSLVANKDQSQLSPDAGQAFAYAAPNAPSFKDWSDYIQPGAVQAATQMAQSAIPSSGGGLFGRLGGVASGAMRGLGGLASTAGTNLQKVAGPLQMLASTPPEVLGALGIAALPIHPQNTATGLGALGLTPAQAQTYLNGGAAQQAANPVPLVAALTGALNPSSGSIQASSGGRTMSPFHST